MGVGVTKLIWNEMKMCQSQPNQNSQIPKPEDFKKDFWTRGVAFLQRAEVGLQGSTGHMEEASRDYTEKSTNN